MSTEESPLEFGGFGDREGINGDGDQLRQRKGKLITCAKETISNGRYFAMGFSIFF